MSAEQAARIRGLEAEGHDTAVRLLIRHGVLDQQILARELSRICGHPLATDWPDRPVLPEAVSLRFMRERHVLPLAAQAAFSICSNRRHPRGSDTLGFCFCPANARHGHRYLR